MSFKMNLYISIV